MTRLREQVVAKLIAAAESTAERLEKSGEPSGTRTRDSLLKSALEPSKRE